MKNPFRRIATLESQVANLRAALTDTHTKLAEQAKQIAALVRDDAQIAALRRIVTATEYNAAAEKHDRQSRMVKHEF